MRTLTDHKLGSLNEKLEITVFDEPGNGGACHYYAITNLARTWSTTKIEFQDGPIKEVGVNGISGEALLAIVIDRLRSFQTGPFACRENAIALTHLETSLMWLQKRTHDRISRGVEGTYVK